MQGTRVKAAQSGKEWESNSFPVKQVCCCGVPLSSCCPLTPLLSEQVCSLEAALPPTTCDCHSRQTAETVTVVGFFFFNSQTAPRSLDWSIPRLPSQPLLIEECICLVG